MNLGRCIPAGFALLALFASVSVRAEEDNRDPLESFNRAMFTINDTADRYAIRPLAKGYSTVTPDPVENGIHRMYENLGEIVNVVNDLFQGKFRQAGNDTGRFLINSTIGVAGFFDVAEHMGLDKSEGEDFGQTLAKWGIGSGPYLVLPIFGPSTFRDAPGRAVDGFLNPLREIDHVPTRNTVYGVGMLTDRASLLKSETLISGDKYAFIRDVYLQRRNYLINDGETEDDFGAGDEYGDF